MVKRSPPNKLLKVELYWRYFGSARFRVNNVILYAPGSKFNIAVFNNLNQSLIS
jgi:hypothetical protein